MKRLNPVRFECVAMPARDLQGVIVFVKHTNTTSGTFGIIKQYHYTCSEFFDSSHYFVYCSTGTNARSSEVKHYVLQIMGMRPEDYGDWTCEILNGTTKSQRVTIKELGEHCFQSDGERERNVLFNNALNTFYLRLYGVRHMVKEPF